MPPRNVPATPVSPGEVGASPVAAQPGVYPALYPARARLPCSELLACSETLACDEGATGSYPGHGSDLAMGRPGTRVLAVTPV